MKLQHVSTPFPAGRQADVRRFYGEVLGLSEVEVPRTLDAGRLVWYSSGDGMELHFFSGELAPGSARHFCLDVDDLARTRGRLSEAGFAPYDDTPIPNRPRFFCRDPFDNLVEFTSIQGTTGRAEPGHPGPPVPADGPSRRRRQPSGSNGADLPGSVC